jgi:hypothetical protein
VGVHEGTEEVLVTPHYSRGFDSGVGGRPLYLYALLNTKPETLLSIQSLVFELLVAVEGKRKIR